MYVCKIKGQTQLLDTAADADVAAAVKLVAGADDEVATRRLYVEREVYSLDAATLLLPLLLLLMLLQLH